VTVLPNAASVALINRDRVLLIQRARAPYFGLWTLPGGRLEPGEDAEACATREVHEEVGLRCYALRPVTRLRLGDSGQFNLQVFATEAFEGEIVPSDEVSGHRWVQPDKTDELELTPHLPDVLERAFRMFDRT
jgi:8-oxo-dGTP diphosphatase